MTPRIHVLLAKEAKSAVVIRRGPAGTSAVIGWNRTDDSFQVGQWVRARIYEHRCDLSPDGKWFIYFALSGRWNSETEGAYTAISIAPYLKAVTLFPDGNTWTGGGFFQDNKTYWLNGGFGGKIPVREDRQLKRSSIGPATQLREGYSWADRIYFFRLQSCGWKLEIGSPKEEGITVFEKEMENGWALRKFVHEGRASQEGKGSMWEEHELRHARSGLMIPGEDWEWADVDRSRVVWASKGCINASKLSETGLRNPTLLNDFNGMKFQPLVAPY